MGLNGSFIAHERGLHAFLVEMRGAKAGAIEFIFERQKKFGGAGLEAFDDVIGDGIHELQDVTFAKQFLAELVEAFEFAAAADGLVSFLANAGGKLTPHGGNKKECAERHPILRVRDGERVDGRQKIIIEDQHGGERHHDGDSHSPHCRNC